MVIVVLMAVRMYWEQGLSLGKIASCAYSTELLPEFLYVYIPLEAFLIC